MPDDVPRTLRAPRRSHAHFITRRKKATAASPCTQRRAVPVRAASAAPEFDAEGRYLQADFGELTVISVYLPSGSSGAAAAGSQVPLPRRVPAAPRAAARRADAKSILCGDWNIAHQPIDLKNWRSNQKNSGFLPEERAWLTRVFDELGFVDVFRRINRATRAIHLVVESRPGLGQERRLAHRLPDRDAGHCRDGARGGDLHEPALLGSRAADHRLRLPAVARGDRDARCCA